MFTPSHPQIYDSIGEGYASHRMPDSRIAKAIHGALTGCRTVCNVGAGAGSYEPPELDVTAVEPSARMIEQRVNSSPVVQASAEDLPFADDTFDASMAVLTVHHWSNLELGLAELKRVSRRQVLLTFDPDMIDSFWLVRDYFPEAIDFDRSRFVPLSAYSESLNVRSVSVIKIPWDCTDGFQAAYWRRPECYLDPEVRQAISTFAQIAPAVVDQGIQRLSIDIESGAWHERYSSLLNVNEMDFGYRLVIAGELEQQ